MGELLIDKQGDFTFQLEEADGGKTGKIIMRGQFARSDKATENKRLYREHLWRREFGRLGESMENRRMYGELDHPSDGRTKLQRVSHLVTGLRIEGNEVIGEAEVLDTPNGRILKALAKANASVGVSSRGFGSTKTIADGVQEVQEDFRLDTFDFVADPATKTAYPRVFREERERIEEAEVLTLDILKRDYPGLVEELASEVGAGAGGGPLSESQIVAETERRTVERLTEQFSGKLRRSLETLETDVRAEVRSELMSDPQVAGARQVVEQIVGLVKSYGMDAEVAAELDTTKAKLAEMEKKLTDRELEVQAAEAQANEMRQLAKEAAYRLHLERLIGKDSSRKAIEALVGDVTTFESLDDIDKKVDAIRQELERRGGPAPEEGNEEATTKEDIEKLQTRIAELEGDLKKAQDGRETATERANKADEVARKAVEVAEGLEVQLHVQRQVVGRDAGDREAITKLCEEASTIEEADRLIEGYEPRTKDDDEASRIRSRVQKGTPRSLSEDTFGRPGSVDGLREVGSPAGNGRAAVPGLEEAGVRLDQSSFEKLSGQTPQRN